MLTFRYLPMTEEDKNEMLSYLGIKNIDELFADIPEQVRFNGRLDIPEAMDEPGLSAHAAKLAGKNADFSRYVNFLGAGVYEHYIPSVVNHVISRSEFYTAYTPYQPEISQGELQAIFEYQSMICALTGMEVANSSMYDGLTALAEAAGLAFGATNRKKVIVSRAVHPQARAILVAHGKGLGFEVVEADVSKQGVTDVERLEQLVDEETAAVIVQYPNFFGCIEDLTQLEPIAHKHNSLFVVSANPLALGVLKPPGECGADIVVGDAQPFGIPASFGGPHVGYFAVTQKLMRRIPGRIVGQTKDEQGRRGFVLTLQAREQHIRREKATSNICSNQALMALAAAVGMTALGKQGVQEIGRLNLEKAHYARKRLAEAGLGIAFDTPFFNEFVVKVQRPVADVNRELLQNGIIGGYDLGRDYPELAGNMLVAVTELRTKKQIDALAQRLEGMNRG